jgi:pyruvate-ferredoxin/flavodoxin oxidoreductase
MSKAQAEIRKAVAAGYWPLYRYNPDLDQPLTIDSKDPTESYQDFIRGETRYQTLLKMFPDAAEKLFAQNEEDAKVRLANYKRMAGQ